MRLVAAIRHSPPSQIASLFNPSHQKVLPGDTHANQPRSLANAVYAYAANIDNLGALTSAVTRIAEKHVSLQIEASQYDVVGEHLVSMIASRITAHRTQHQKLTNVHASIALPSLPSVPFPLRWLRSRRF